MLFQSRQRNIEKKIDAYNETVIECVEKYGETIKSLIETSDRDELRQNASEVSSAESRADDLRREIEVMMYSKAVFPESRRDILTLLESMDRVPNHAESVCRMLVTHHIVIPDFLEQGVLELIEICSRCVRQMIEAVRKLFSDYINASVAIGKVDELESNSDWLENELIDKIFTSDVSSLDKILLRDLVTCISAVCDKAENVCDGLRIIITRRRI